MLTTTNTTTTTEVDVYDPRHADWTRDYYGVTTPPVHYYGCGHDGRMDLRRTTRGDREAILLREQKGQCEDCREAARADYIAAQREQSAALEAERELPALSGSPKQVSWATDIRARLLLAAEATLPETLRVAGEKQVVARKSALAILLAERSDAKWWIERRDWSGQNLVGNAEFHVI